MRLRAPVRNAWWRLRGSGIRNPPVPSTVNSILFVCLGNICRTPFGAEIAKRLLAQAGRSDVRCTSAGIRPSRNKRSPDDACRASLAYGVSLNDHRPQVLTRELMESHDVVVVMEWWHLAHLRAAYPELHDRIVLLSLLDDEASSAYERYHIADPWGQPIAAFDECYRRMDRILRRWLAVQR